MLSRPVVIGMSYEGNVLSFFCITTLTLSSLEVFSRLLLAEI
jgi:hypothetical protein